MNRIIVVSTLLCLASGGAGAWLSSPMMNGVVGGNLLTSIPLAADGTAYWVSNLNESWIDKNHSVTSGNTQYLCYFNTASPPSPKFLLRNLTTNAITSVDPGLPAAASDDEHGACALAIDTAGIMHVSYGQHGTGPGGLIYYRGATAVTASSVGGPFTKHSMVSGNTTVESSVTYPYFMTNPTTGVIYLTFRYFGSGNGNQYFYSYNAGTSTWSAAAGTATCAGQGTGCLINDMGNSPTTSPYLNGIPKWDATGKLWFSWAEQNAAGATFNQYLMAWNGTTFQDAFGNAVTTPVLTSSFTPIVTVGTAQQMVVQNDFTINEGTFYIPYSRLDGNSLFQIYVAESSTGSFVEHPLTSNTVNPPVGCGSNAGSGSGVIQCEARVTALGNSDGSVYIVYPDIFNLPPGSGILVTQSMNSFVSFTTSVLIPSYKPNFGLNPDPSRMGSVASFMVMDSADYEFGYFASSTPPYTFSHQGSMRSYDWALSYTPGTPTRL